MTSESNASLNHRWPALPRLNSKTQAPPLAEDRAAHELSGAASIGPRAAAAARYGRAALSGLRKFSRQIRPCDWQRRYLTFLSLLHRHVFDRSIERLLFHKTAQLEGHSARLEDGSRTPFRYQGPVPRKVFAWALSALPESLKRYAFVDFGAGHGRTLLLAAQHDFEHAIGYVYDTESCEKLEMNLAQYSRSYMRCRDVRALRGDRETIAIPEQPAVLFFPDSLSAGQLGVLIAGAAASLAQAPRPLYLIFENAGREGGLEPMENFERVQLPAANQLKAWLFSPANIAVYRFASGEEDGSPEQK